MKTIISLAAVVIVTLCTLQARAQVPASIPEATTGGLKNEFAEAFNIKWQKVNANIFLARFSTKKDNCIAFVEQTGKVVLTGREIALDNSPVLLQRNLSDAVRGLERKNGVLQVTKVYELTRGGALEYYIVLNNGTVSVSLMSDAQCVPTVISRTTSSHKNVEEILAGR
jgi:hypothetical protein